LLTKPVSRLIVGNDDDETKFDRSKVEELGPGIGAAATTQ
jgi:hypothetical protein